MSTLTAVAALAVSLTFCTETPAPSQPVAPSAPAAAPEPTAPASAGPVAVDALAPDFSATASDGTPLQIAALKGKPVVVYFYPKDETPGCTAEACAFRDAWTALSAKGVVLIGVSADTDESHRGFTKNHQLPFHLVSDTSGAIAAKFGVPPFARQTFVIGADGKLKKIYRTVDVGAHAAQITADLQ